MIDFITIFIIVWVFCFENILASQRLLQQKQHYNWVCCESKQELIYFFLKIWQGYLHHRKLSSTVTPGLCSVSNHAITKALMYFHMNITLRNIMIMWHNCSIPDIQVIFCSFCTILRFRKNKVLKKKTACSQNCLTIQVTNTYQTMTQRLLFANNCGSFKTKWL